MIITLNWNFSLIKTLRQRSKLIKYTTDWLKEAIKHFQAEMKIIKLGHLEELSKKLMG